MRFVSSNSSRRAVSLLTEVQLSNWRAWPHFVLTIVGLAPSNALWSYMPTIIASFGYNKLGANAMSSVAQWISACLVLFAGYVACVTIARFVEVVR